MHENVLKGVKYAFQSVRDSQAACVFLVKDLCISSYNQRILLYDENAIFILQNAFLSEENEMFPLVKRAAIDAIALLSSGDQLVSQLVFEDILIELLARSDVQDEIEAILGVLRGYYVDENFEQDREKLKRILDIIKDYESDVCEEFARFALGEISDAGVMTLSRMGAEDEDPRQQNIVQ